MWNHGIGPLPSGVKRPFYRILELFELSAAVRYTTDGGEFNEMPEGREEMLAVGELPEGVFEGGKVITRRLRGWLGARLSRHTAPLSMSKKRALIYV
jgi:hypothetical protein